MSEDKEIIKMRPMLEAKDKYEALETLRSRGIIDPKQADEIFEKYRKEDSDEGIYNESLLSKEERESWGKTSDEREKMFKDHRKALEIIKKYNIPTIIDGGSYDEYPRQAIAIHLDKINKDIEEAFGKNNKDTEELRKYRVEALKIATQIAIKIEHFEPNYSSFEDPMVALFADIEIIHKIADYNLKYIMGE